MEDFWQTRNRLAIKSQYTNVWDQTRRAALNEDGGVGLICLCGHYDIDSSFGGFCRDEECRRERFKKALVSGEAMKLPNGDIVWTPGFKIRKET